jgi:hypothetical protein
MAATTLEMHSDSQTACPYTKLARMLGQHHESRRNSQPLWRRFGVKGIAVAIS